MRVIGVLDLMAGRAVRAQGGRRERYQPITQVGDLTIDAGDAVALARAYVDHFAIDELYAADLDAITSGSGERDVVTSLAQIAPLWLDAGISSVADAQRAMAAGAARVIVGLETLTSFTALAEICDAVGSERVAFSLDLRDGLPLGTATSGIGASTDQLAAAAAHAGVSTVILLDLARVGAATGVDLAAFSRIRAAAPSVLLLTGGGVRGPLDLAPLAAAGCDGVLIASALLDGRFTAHDVARARQL